VTPVAVGAAVGSVVPVDVVTPLKLYVPILCPQLTPIKKVKNNALNSRMPKVLYFLVNGDFGEG
jgi:hypothetical protein